MSARFSSHICSGSCSASCEAAASSFLIPRLCLSPVSAHSYRTAPDLANALTTSRRRGCGAASLLIRSEPLAAVKRRWQSHMIDRTGILVGGCVLETLLRRVHGVSLDAGVDVTCMQRARLRDLVPKTLCSVVESKTTISQRSIASPGCATFSFRPSCGYNKDKLRVDTLFFQK